MAAKLLTLLIVCAIKAVYSQVASWTIKIGTVAGGTGGTGDSGSGADNVTATLYWDDSEAYECTFTPDGTAGKTYNCDTNTAVTLGNDTKNYVRFEYSAEDIPIAIDTITVTLTTTETFTIEHFCIHSQMHCNQDTNSTGSCAQWNKDKYSVVKMGSSTELSLIYVDFPHVLNHALFVNYIHEGSVRPPNIKYIHGNITNTFDTQDVSVKWDNVYYACALTVEQSTYGNCAVSDMAVCQGMDAEYWVSIRSRKIDTGDIYKYIGVDIEDETGTHFYFSEWCQEVPGSGVDLNGNYSYPPYTLKETCALKLNGNDNLYQTRIIVGGASHSRMISWVVPDNECVLALTSSNAIEIQVLNTGDSGLYGWGPGLYGMRTDTNGGGQAMSCYPTPVPTQYPTKDPTIDPTLDPTIDPTVDPTIDPTNDPTADPTADPTIDPTFDPTQNPTTGYPTVDPTTDPSANPTTAGPSVSPSEDPTNAPTDSPTDFPTVFAGTEGIPVTETIITENNIKMAIIALAIFLLCILCCVVIIYIQRNKRKQKEKETKAAPMVAAAAYSSEPAYASGGYHQNQDTYGEYDCGAINTAPSMMDEDSIEHYGGQYEAKENVELAEVKEEEQIETQYTIDGGVAGSTGGTGENKGDDAVLDMLADGHETGAKAKGNNLQAGGSPITEINKNETFAEYAV